MTKHKHHPHTRAERLALKQELDEKPKTQRPKVWRKLSAEALKEWEAKNELREHTGNPSSVV